MKFSKLFKKIGFSEKEAAVYLQLISLGVQTVSVLARHTEINRTTMYDILESLKKRGIVQSHKKNGSMVYKALSPKELIHFLEREKDETIRRIKKQQAAVKELLPELLSLEHAESTRPKVTFYEGENSMREAYEDTLTAKEEILAFANVEEMHKALPNFFPEYYKRRAIDHKIAVQAIMPSNKISVERAAKDSQENRTSALVDHNEYNFSPEINIYNDKVLITSWREKMAILIESKEIADFHRCMHRLCWEQSKKNKS